ncbi:hypothetical protein H6P81_015324 [Aristolochia fimbriata]|uniref:Cyclic nucleotide-binding domain-containing protein n=1 Tax=Aristolochia fimbriata TaxID=158543 RepID=A0AAV7E5V5_ARIFI|nr:hypothetical protein H6P81_015324 [Aristolochia fimbriata]
MAADVPSPPREEPADSLDAVLFVGVCLVLGVASKLLFRGSRVPYTVVLLLLGVAIGAIEYGTNHGLGKLGTGIRLWANINPDLLLCVFLPALLFEGSYYLEVHQIKRCMQQMLLLAGPGVLISTFLIGTAVKLIFPYHWDWRTSLLLGGLLCATDPVAVVALLKDLRASKKLTTIIDGESMMNDGFSIVVFQLFYQMVLGQGFNIGTIIKYLLQVSLGAVAVGLVFGLLTILCLRFSSNDTIIDVATTMTLAVSYITYFTAQNVVGVSGVLAVTTLGMFCAILGRVFFKGDDRQNLQHFWERVTYFANTIIFILSGIVIAEGVFHSDHHFHSDGTSWGYLILLYLVVQISRTIEVGLLYPLLRYFGYGLDWREAIILVWSGLRGAVSLALSLSVKYASDKLDPYYLKQEIGMMFVFFTGGIVFFTLIVNGSTAQFLLYLLDMNKLSIEKMGILDYTRHEMLEKAHEAFADLGDDEELGPADWSTTKRYITCLSTLGEKVHPHNVLDGNNGFKIMNLKDTRVRILNCVQAAYWAMLEEGRVNKRAASLLLQSVDNAIDMTGKSLCDWDDLKSHIRFPSYYNFLQMSFWPKKLVMSFMVERLEIVCYICAAFLRAHGFARTNLQKFIGSSDIVSTVIAESEAEEEEARKFLKGVRTVFPEVLQVLKTRQVTKSILMRLSEYLQNLEKLGLLESNEISLLQEAVQNDFKKILKSPPLVKMPKIKDVISNHPLLAELPPQLLELIDGSTKVTLKLQGVALYREGSNPDGFWVISKGVFKWSCKSLNNKNSSPQFLYGSTPGLYEVLSRKPYLCDLVTDSVVYGLFIKAETILTSLGSHDIEQLLWKESAIIILKILVPHLFEETPLQELRALITETSTMKTIQVGEIIEIKAHIICFLLEGVVRSRDSPESFISSPAALALPADLGLHSKSLGTHTHCHEGSTFEVSARARFRACGSHELAIELWNSSSTSWICFSIASVNYSDQKELNSMGRPHGLFNFMAFMFTIYPSLILTYAGQTAYLIKNPGDYGDAFYKFVPSSVYWPMFVVATSAAIVASQSMISAIFSVIKQTVLLDYFPRVTVVHTSSSHEGEVYCPEINHILMVLCVAIVLGFGDSKDIGNAFGVVVTQVMLITTIMLTLVMIIIWKTPLFLACLYFTISIALEGAYTSSVFTKIPQGGWVTFAISILLAVVMFGWYFGRVKKVEFEMSHKTTTNDLDFLSSQPEFKRLPGLCFFFINTKSDVLTPLVSHYIKNLQSLHRVTMFVTLKYLPVPKVESHERVYGVRVGGLSGVYRCVIHYGFAELAEIRSASFIEEVVDELKACIRGGLSSSMDVEEEISELEKARQVGVMDIRGRTRFCVGKKASWFDKIVLGFYEFLHRNCRSGLPDLAVPLLHRIEVGMLYDV